MQVFSKEWFEYRQAKLLWLVNTRLGRRLLRIHGNRSSVGKNKITKITPNSISWDDKTEFRTHDKFAKRLYYGLKPLWFVLHGWDTLLGNKWSFGFDTLTQYPGSSGANNPVDGRTGRSGVDESRTVIISSAGNDTSYTDTANYLTQLTGSATTNQYSAAYLSIYLFDTSAIGDSDTVSAAVFSLWGAGKQSTLGSPDLHAASTGSGPAASTSLTNTDYDNAAGQTSYGSISYASFDATDSTYSDITLNGSGIAAVSKTGNTKISAQLSWFYNATGLTWSSGANSRFYAYYSDETGTSKDPKLVVTYGAPVANTHKMLTLGAG